MVKGLAFLKFLVYHRIDPVQSKNERGKRKARQFNRETDNQKPIDFAQEREKKPTRRLRRNAERVNFRKLMRRNKTLPIDKQDKGRKIGTKGKGHRTKPPKNRQSTRGEPRGEEQPSF